MTLTHRPCGVCRALVTPAGCRHWHPNQQVDEALQVRRNRNNLLKQRQRDAKKKPVVPAPVPAAVKKPPVTESGKKHAAEIETARANRYQRAVRRQAAAERTEAVTELTRVLTPRDRRTSTNNPIGASVTDLEQATGESYR